MELVEGPTLAAYLREHPKLSFEEATSILEQMLAVLGAAHASGILHRDVKPANVLLAEDGQVKLADFGIAKVLSDASAELTLHGHVMGTPTYLAPERVAGHDASRQSDLYSAAVIGYEMVAGKPPFKGENVAATLAAHQRSPVPALLDVRPDAPPEYAAAVERGLAKDPADRFASAEEMRDALTQPAFEETIAVRTQTMTVPPVAPLPPLRDPERTPTPRPVAKPKPKPKRQKRAATTTQSRRRLWPWVLVGALLLGLVAGAIVGLTGSDKPLPDTSAQEPVTTTPTLPATSVPQIPQNLTELTALLAADPTKYGSAGPELLKKLQEYQAKPDTKRFDDLVKKTNDWILKGQLNAEFGALVLRVLGNNVLGSAAVTTPATAAPAPAAGPGHGPKPKEPRGKGRKG
jgi:serine/threonine-protein kinase